VPFTYMLSVLIGHSELWQSALWMLAGVAPLGHCWLASVEDAKEQQGTMTHHKLTVTHCLVFSLLWFNVGTIKTCRY